MADEQSGSTTLGPNAWLVDEMYSQYVNDPASVSESWRDFFADYRRDDASKGSNGQATPATLPTPAADASVTGGPTTPPAAGDSGPKTAAPSATAGPAASAAPALASDAPAPAKAPEVAEALRGVAAKIAENMSSSLTVPTATSFRQVPARLLEVNRKIVNNHLMRTRGGKVSFTHFIGYAVVQALKDMPVMNSAYAEVDGKPGVIRHTGIGLGLAVDVTKKDGSHTLMTPCIKGADSLDFRGFWQAYEELIRKVRTNKISVDDFAGITVSLTNPGTIGTIQSVPRLMPGQGLIVGVGALDHPAEWQGADPRMLAELGVSKVMTVTSTYDHRIIQGAESGMFLQRVHKLLTGVDGFYEGIFRSLGVPYEPVAWRRDINPVDSERSRLEKQVHVQTLINMYRVRGHLIAALDPLAATEPRMHPELDPATYGLTIWDLDREFFTDTLAGKDTMTLGDILGVLRDAYCRTIGVEYMHIQEVEEKHWIQRQVEGVSGNPSPEEKRHILTRLNAAEAFERFLNTKYLGAKRFGIEGAESAIPLIDALLDEAAEQGLAEAVMGMAHRGRLNVLANIVGKSYKELFREFEGDIDPDTVQGSGDVKYHKGATGKFVGLSVKALALTLASNPSHLEAVDPVVEGMARAKQDLTEHDPDRPFPVLSVLVHGDAAFAGQGVVAETLNLSTLRGYRTGGTVHLVINNQVGFTTNPQDARSSVYATDVAKMVQAPIFHVNGDDPEACVRVARLAVLYRERFHKDVVIDMVCYRRFGHNEADDPSFTQPKMYQRIEAHRSVRKLYTEALVNRGDISIEEAERALEDFSSRLQVALDETKASKRPQPTTLLTRPDEILPTVATGVDQEVLDRISRVSTSAPDGFNLHPKLAKIMGERAKSYADGLVDYGSAEALALGSVLLEGTDVRLAGQDSRRGTFAHRHSVMVDYASGAEYVPLANLEPGQGRFNIYDSLLSEYAALGFEYGYSVVHKDALVVWEAQFGDFVNGSQIIIDQFVVAAEDKWGQTSGLVMVLPHGYDGQGPEHSSARIERFLQLAAEENIVVAYPTTAAQYFHMLRRQARWGVRKPLIVALPKALLRAAHARSAVSELVNGSFREVLDDPSVADTNAVRRVVLCSGKVAYDMIAGRDEATSPVAVVRVEQLYPWPDDLLSAVLGRYPNLGDVVWLQEEPENMGAWTFVQPRLLELLGDDYALRNVSRVPSGSPATGSHGLHKLEQADLITRSLDGL
ncbi:MAG TPA: multifunctional oxoglutarate decarboxylase/oxoglutarate dehydrogenase thiamine pyrophosphate-binding subunit/dihydrolipoyllysine-residue succinyltransferase subunit [Acidimicrobiales bacterium]|nr:multifunctional oxoglutarate decarboxylase/oxoglutarate dehydrogenase thiamine pyrophosphate-binding subunit/dihydrolipoyllysine-residue succinyltransferase subunit [Acidimicrobiales bacterium]